MAAGGSNNGSMDELSKRLDGVHLGTYTMDEEDSYV